MQMPFNLFRALRFITVFKEWLFFLSYTNRICFHVYLSQQFSSYNSVGLMCSCKYLWWNLSNSPGTSTLIYWEILPGMQPQITVQFALLTTEVITQLKHHTVQRATGSAAPVTNKDVVLWQHMGWQLWQKVMFMSTFGSLLLHDPTSQKSGCRICKLNVNMQTYPSICRSEEMNFQIQVQTACKVCVGR